MKKTIKSTNVGGSSGPVYKVRILFKHTEGPSTDHPFPPSCAEPIGLCLLINIGPKPLPLPEDRVVSTPVGGCSCEDMEDDIGTADLILVDKNHLKIIPYSPKYSDAKGNVPVTNDIPLPIEIANGFGFKTLIIARGNYLANLREGQFGYVIVNVY